MGVNLKRSNYAYKYPFERIASYAAAVASKYADPSLVKALDFGFGGGRHLKVLSDLGYNTYGIDVTEDAIDTAYYNFGENFIPREKLSIDNIMEHPIYPEGYFDVILSVGVLWALGYEQMLAFLDRLIPLMKENGYLIANFRTKFDDLYVSDSNKAHGKEDRKHRMGGGGVNDAYVPQFNHIWAFLDINDLKRLMKQYGMTIEMLERYDRYYDNVECISYWCVAARKG